MARSRSMPTELLKDPDFFEQSSDTQVILIALVLTADDEGRGQAHVGLLSRTFNKGESLILQALQDLEARAMLVVYQVGRHSYYQLTRWEEWQTLSKPTPSKFPAPPQEKFVSPDGAGKPQNSPGDFGETQESPEFSGETPPEGKGREEKGKEEEGEEEVKSRPANVVTFPTTDNNAEDFLTCQIAGLLKIAPTPALQRVLLDFRQQVDLSLAGEADAAREWIDDRQRNRKGKKLTPAFFRHWLQRECDAIQRRKAQVEKATGTDDQTRPGRVPGAPPMPSLMDLEHQYHKDMHQQGRKK